MDSLKKFIFKTIAVASALVTGLSGTAYAVTYKDVASTHWAYSAVDSVSDKGLMVGDLSGNFNPDNSIDKFETSKLLAKMTGYKYSGATEEEQLYYQRCYDNNKSFINQFVSKFKRWNSTYNNEIAYLLEKEIYTPNDINQFVILVNNEERLRALSREEACMYLTKVMGKASEAESAKQTALFGDDSAITAGYKPYVYYFKELGIVKGDTQNNFNPKGAASKAAMAIMINSVLNIMDGGTISKPKDNTSAQGNAIETVQASITKLYTTARAVQISSANEKYNNKIYIVSSNATININGFVKTYADLTEGMVFTGVFSGNELIAVTVSANAVLPPVSSPSTPVTPAPSTNAQEIIKIEGTIVSAKSDTTGKKIELETRTISPKGEIRSDVKTYTISETAVITRSGVTTTFAAIVKGDIGTIHLNGNTVSKIELEEKDIAFTGTLLEKRIKELTGVPTLLISDKDGKTYDLAVQTNTEITRKGSGAISWSELRIGDTVDIKAEYDSLISIYGYGTKSSIDVWVRDIYISASLSKITAVDSGNKESVYHIIAGSVDPYLFRVGSKVRLRLDSREVESFTVLEDYIEGTAAGIITSVTNSNITIKDNSSTYAASKEFKYNSNTVVINSKTGKTVSSQYLDTDMTVYVVFSDSVSNLATTITILSE